MLVMDKDGDIFDERRKKERRVNQRRQLTKNIDEDDIQKRVRSGERRKAERRVEDINKKNK